MNDEGNSGRLALNAAHGSPPQARVVERRSSASARMQGATPRQPYDRPELEALGCFRALTLQQSVPIGPGG